MALLFFAGETVFILGQCDSPSFKRSQISAVLFDVGAFGCGVTDVCAAVVIGSAVDVVVSIDAEAVTVTGSTDDCVSSSPFISFAPHF